MFEQADHLDDWFKKIKGKHRIVYDANINFSLIAFVLLL
jgi:Txe/YoeB family toxin of Txe-Axe toxin-antitoxin module